MAGQNCIFDGILTAMDYRLELLSEDKFEDLTNAICKDQLGIGVVVFAKGKDGGRDGKFAGTAEKYPSSSEQWQGKFIIQAKHTSNPIASCSDTEFEKIVEREIPKLKKLKDGGEVDCYLLFTNRKHTAIKTTELEKYIKQQTEIANVAIIGKETINKQYLDGNKPLIKQFQLDVFSLPFDFSSSDLKELVIAFKDALTTDMEDSIKKQSEEIKHNYLAISKEEKNAKNDLGKDYYEHVILKNSLQYFTKIDEFLRNPINSELKDYYYDIIAELNQIVTIKRDNFGAFEEILGFIYQQIVDDRSLIRGKKRFVLIFLHYMYFNCDLGIK